MKLADSQGRWKLDGPIVWTPELVQILEASEDKITRTFDHWLDRIIGGFMTEFAVDTSLVTVRGSGTFSKVREVST